MRRSTRWSALLAMLLAFITVWGQSVSARADASEPASAPKVREILEEARIVIFRHKKATSVWYDLLPDIPRLQLKAGNVDDALAALEGLSRGSAEPVRIEIAETMARAGR